MQKTAKSKIIIYDTFLLRDMISPPIQHIKPPIRLIKTNFNISKHITTGKPNICTANTSDKSYHNTYEQNNYSYPLYGSFIHF